MTFASLRRLLPCLGALIIGASSAAFADTDTTVIASVTWADGRDTQHKLPEDVELKLDTCAGRLSFPVDAISSIDILAGSNLMTVSLVSGERWRAVAREELLTEIGIELDDDGYDPHGGVKRISLSASPAPHCTASHYMKLLLEDGSHAYLDPAELEFPVETEHSKWNLPAGSVRALKFITPLGGDRPDTILVRFPTGYVERLQLRSRSATLRVRDCHGNKLKVRHEQIKGLLSPSELIDTASTDTGASRSAHSYRIRKADGSAERVTIPVALWKIETSAGTIELPSPLVSSIKSDNETTGTVELRTIYGEILSGRWTARSITVEAKATGEIFDVKTRDILELTTTTPELPIPDDWLAFYLHDNIAVAARFTEKSTGLVTEDDEAVPPRSVYSLTPLPDRGFTIASKLGQVRTCTPETRKAALVLLSNGRTIYLPWKDIHLAKTQSAILESTIIRIAEADQDSAPETKVVAEEQDNTEKSRPESKDTTKLSTSIGTIRLSSGTISEIAIDATAGRACVKTVFGDHFLVPAPRRKWMASILADDGFEFPEDDTFVISTGASTSPATQLSGVVCRLLSGDILRGTLTPQELSLRRQASRQELDISASDIEQMTRNLDGELLFKLRQDGLVAGEIREKNLAFDSFASEETLDIPFNMIEALAKSLSELPPSTVIHPGMPAFLTGEVFVDGGTYEQGSSRGIEDEQPVHTVSVGSFYMDATELTRAQFAAFVRKTGYVTAAEDASASATWRAPGFLQRNDDPVVCLSWVDAVTYCNWRSKEADLGICYSINKDMSVDTDRTANGYRLPTEAEWEFAARDRGKDVRFPWADSTSDVSAFQANYRQTSRIASDGWEWTSPVKAFPANPLGIYGLAGNVWEWCEDWYFDRAYASLRGRLVHNPCITLDGTPFLNRRVMRGGSFRNDLDLLRCTSRGSGIPFAYSNRVGFRCVRNAE